VIVKLPEFKVPVVLIFCDPKSGEIFVPAIDAVLLISPFTIVKSAIFALVTLLSEGTPTANSAYVIIKKSAPVAGAAANIISSPSIAKPSLGLVPELGF